MHNILHFNCGFLHTPHTHHTHTHTHAQIETDKHTARQTRHKAHIGKRYNNSGRSPRQLHDELANHVGGSKNCGAQVVKAINANDK